MNRFALVQVQAKQVFGPRKIDISGKNKLRSKVSVTMFDQLPGAEIVSGLACRGG